MEERLVAIEMANGITYIGKGSHTLLKNYCMVVTADTVREISDFSFGYFKFLADIWKGRGLGDSVELRESNCIVTHDLTRFL